MFLHIFCFLWKILKTFSLRGLANHHKNYLTRENVSPATSLSFFFGLWPTTLSVRPHGSLPLLIFPFPRLGVVLA